MRFTAYIVAIASSSLMMMTTNVVLAAPAPASAGAELASRTQALDADTAYCKPDRLEELGPDHEHVKRQCARLGRDQSINQAKRKAK
ncbi:hypothetical protein F5Y17DRAFT_411686 [Xylariaceae sp. FL0594]|nr:hypothetical protein F5Y17DRAFT_411686 [Xylariaceae sp. FL0594]